MAGGMPGVPVPNNMGMVRYILALAVIVAHFNLWYGARIWWPVSSFEGVGGFFALSGFLVYGSYAKNPSLKSYIKSRAWRILPPYCFIVLLAALSLWLLSDVGPAAYFSSPQTWKYLVCNLCFLNWLQPALPGVFGGEAVNGSLWTMKVEWALYLSVPLVFLAIKRLRLAPGRTFVAVIATGIVYTVSILLLAAMHPRFNSLEVLSRQFVGQLSYFYMGVLIRWRLQEFLSARWLWLVVSLALMILGTFDLTLRALTAPVAISALVLLASLWGRWGTWEYRRDNLSYNIYLFHWPVIMILLSLGVANPWIAFPAVISITFALSWLVVRFVEKPLAARWRS